MMWGLVFQIMPPFHFWSAKKVRIYTLGKQILLHRPNIESYGRLEGSGAA